MDENSTPVSCSTVSEPSKSLCFRKESEPIVWGDGSRTATMAGAQRGPDGPAAAVERTYSGCSGNGASDMTFRRPSRLLVRWQGDQLALDLLPWRPDAAHPHMAEHFSQAARAQTFRARLLSQAPCREWH